MIGWLKRMLGFRRPPPVDHAPAQHALVRAIEDKHKAEAMWLPVASVIAHLAHERAKNGFGEDLKTAMKRTRG